jgi:hypothetical protein
MPDTIAKAPISQTTASAPALGNTIHQSGKGFRHGPFLALRLGGPGERMYVPVVGLQ